MDCQAGEQRESPANNAEKRESVTEPAILRNFPTVADNPQNSFKQHTRMRPQRNNSLSQATCCQGIQLA